ncbi:hypothetical protein B566_EDAN013838 [Ephemera danica]|nr:hypothetical protein B566_EDAN013838 [Ephemera danica]
MDHIISEETFRHRFGMTKTEPSQTFYKGTLITRDVKAIFFASTDMLNKLANAKRVYIDGTFKTVPKKPVFKQLLTIHFKLGNHSFAAIWILMDRKTYLAYRWVFTFIKDVLCPGFNPESIMTDYEAALRKALAEIFATSTLLGCYFHYSQAIWRRVQILGLVVSVRNTTAVKKIVAMLMGLALLPSDQIEDGHSAVEQYARREGVYREVKALIKYCRSYWIEKVGAENVSVFGLKHRTNNNIERFHLLLLGCYHPGG